MGPSATGSALPSATGLEAVPSGSHAVGTPLPVAKKTKKFTYIDSSGSFPGLGHCVDGIIQAHLQARDANIRVAELSTYMLEYCEEDIATAMGVELPPAKGSSTAWSLATSAPPLPHSNNAAEDGEVKGTASDVMAALEHRSIEEPEQNLQNTPP